MCCYICVQNQGYRQPSERPVPDLWRLGRGTPPGYRCDGGGEAALEEHWGSGLPDEHERLLHAMSL